VTCQAACRITLSGTTTVAGKRLKLPASKSTLRKAGRARMRVKLPAKAQLAIAAKRPVTVRLVMKATIGTRVVTVRRTVRVTPASREPRASAAPVGRSVQFIPSKTDFARLRT
jgi:hypothetical protein